MGDDHGFNFFTNLYGSTPENGLWILPGSHRSVLPSDLQPGRHDILALVHEAGSDRLPEAVPIVTEPGDVAIVCRPSLAQPTLRHPSEAWWLPGRGTARLCTQAFRTPPRIFA